MKITTTVEVTSEQIANAMVGAIEQGSSAHWCEFFSVEVGGNYRDAEFWDQPFEIVVHVIDDDPITITQDDLQAGLQYMADTWPRHFTNLVTDNDDGETHDVMFQCIALKELTYG
jgi:hypothetical protein